MVKEKNVNETRQVMFDMCLVDANNVKHFTIKNHTELANLKPGEVLWKPFIPVVELNLLQLDKNKLTIKCKIYVVKMKEKRCLNKDLLPLHHPQLGSDLEAMFRSGSLSDVVLVVEGREIPAHRVILALSLIHI